MLTLARRLPFRPSLISDAIVRSVTGPLVGGITPAPLVDIVITLTGNGTVVEGSEYTMNIAASGDDAGTISAYEIDWGDETVEAGSAGDNTHTYADGLNSYTIRVAATHTAGVKRKNKALTVTNVAPVAALSGASTAYVDVEYTVTIGSVTDPGDDTITNYRINWGDGSYDDYASIGAKTHTYTSAEASVDITLDITDEDGTHTAVDTLNIEVSAAVVPYSPATIVPARSEPTPLSPAPAPRQSLITRASFARCQVVLPGSMGCGMCGICWCNRRHLRDVRTTTSPLIVLTRLHSFTLIRGFLSGVVGIF